MANRKRDMDQDGDGEDGGKSEVAEYLHDILNALQKIALANDLKAIAQLVGAAKIEAEKVRDNPQQN